jgi:vacuolar protein sorting-associated protein VTA1
VLNFALRVFGRVDNEDRAGRANLETAKRFRAAADFLCVYRGSFDSEDEDIKEKEKYAKWKAGDIVKALREGRTPMAGPAGGDETQLEQKLESEDVADEAREVEGGLLPGSPSMPPTPSLPPSVQPYPQARPAPPSPSAPVFDAPPTIPSLSTHSSSLTPQAPSPGPPPAAAGYGLRSQTTTPSQPPPPVRQQQQYGDSIPPLAADHFASQAHQAPVDATTISNAQKHARWAISALNYEDLETARKELILALNIIGYPEQR